MANILIPIKELSTMVYLNLRSVTFIRYIHLFIYLFICRVTYISVVYIRLPAVQSVI